MDNISSELLFLIITQIGTCCAYIGGMFMAIKAIEKQISALEMKQDKHNSVIERVFYAEESLKSAHRRLDEVKEDVHDLREDLKEIRHDVHERNEK